MVEGVARSINLIVVYLVYFYYRYVEYNFSEPEGAKRWTMKNSILYILYLLMNSKTHHFNAKDLKVRRNMYFLCPPADTDKIPGSIFKQLLTRIRKQILYNEAIE